MRWSFRTVGCVGLTMNKQPPLLTVKTLYPLSLKRHCSAEISSGEQQHLLSHPSASALPPASNHCSVAGPSSIVSFSLVHLPLAGCLDRTNKLPLFFNGCSFLP